MKLKITLILIQTLIFYTFAEDDLNANVKLHLYTRENSNVGVVLNDNTLNLVDIKRETKIIIHGFFENALRYWLMNMKDAYLDTGNYNVITVDWSYWAIQRPIGAIDNIPRVGSVTADAVIKLAAKGLDVKKVHILGFSMGGHAAGIAGTAIEKGVGKKIGRITGLDAVAKHYENVEDIDRLSKDDADFVDIFHSSWIGLYSAYGTLDCYLNDRFLQHGCPDIYVNGNKTTPIDKLINLVTCSHERSHQYFTESIKCNGIVGYECKSKTEYDLGLCKLHKKIAIGENVPKTAKGSYFVTTNKKAPYHTEHC